MKLEEIFEIVEKSNKLQELLGRKRNGIRIDFYEIKNNKTNLIKHVTTSFWMQILKTFRSEKLQGIPVYKTEFIQTNYNDIFQSYFGNYFIEIKIINELEY